MRCTPRPQLVHNWHSLKTWKKVHSVWFHDDERIDSEPFPIIAHSLRAVSAMFKASGYIFCQGFFAANKARRIRRGCARTQDLETAGKGCIRSILPGRAPLKKAQSQPLDFAQAARITCLWGWNEMSPNRPVDSYALILVGVSYLLGEVEPSNCLGHWCLNCKLTQRDTRGCVPIVSKA